MRFNGTLTKLMIALLGLLLQWGLVVVGGIVVIFFLCLGCELPLPNSNSGRWCKEPNFFYRFTGAVGTIPGEFHNIFGDLNMTGMSTYLTQLVYQYKPAIYILVLTACVACASRYLSGTPIFMVVPQPLNLPRPCIVATTVRGG